MKSVLQVKKECWVCGTTNNIHDHHIFMGNKQKKQSEKFGLKVWLCYYHHNGSNEGVHFDKDLDTHLKRVAQRYFESNIGTRDDFRREFGKSYL